MTDKTLNFGELPAREAFIAQCEAQCPYPMELRCEREIAAIVAVVNQGIDSHLEAVRCEQFDGSHGRWGLRVTDAGSLHTLLRRLTESGDFWGDEDDRENPPIADLCSSILTTLGYEWI